MWLGGRNPTQSMPFQRIMDLEIGDAIALIQQAIDLLQTTHLYGFMQATLVVMIAGYALWAVSGKGN